MAFERKNLGSGQLTTSETTIYQPAVSGVKGVIGALTFYNTHTAQVEVTIYGAHTGSATSANIIDKVTLNPSEEYICRAAVNKVIEGSSTQLLSALASVTSVINFDCAGAEE